MYSGFIGKKACEFRILSVLMANPEIKF